MLPVTALWPGLRVVTPLPEPIQVSRPPATATSGRPCSFTGTVLIYNVEIIQQTKLTFICSSENNSNHSTGHCFKFSYAACLPFSQKLPL